MSDNRTTGETFLSNEGLDASSALSSALEPFTRRLFAEAGLAPGMAVLDLFSGPGDVALLAREAVGEEGEVLGFDPSAALVDYASERTAFRKLENVEFSDRLSSPQMVDAIVGRVVLMYRKDPEADLRSAFRFLRPGGLVIMQELDLLAATTVPTAREIEKTREWIRDVCTVAGIDLQMGPKLYPLLGQAGVCDIKMRVDGLIGGSDSFLPKLLSEVSETLAPLHPLAAPPESQIESHEDRIREELAAAGGVMSTALLISAWGRLRNKNLGAA